MNDWLENHCNGSGPHRSHVTPREVRVMPLGGGANAILCIACWARENRYRHERGWATGAPANFPQVNYYESEVYATEE